MDNNNNIILFYCVEIKKNKTWNLNLDKKGL